MFPSLDHAICCKSMLIDLAPASIDLVRLDAADFLLDESSKTLQNNADPDDDTTLCRRRFFLVFFPAEFTSSAMIFWRTTGTGISSRLGESMHRHLDDIKPAPLTDRIKDTDVLRELVDVDADSLVRSRISDLLNRATINSDKTSRFSAKDVFLYPTGMAAIYETNKLLQLWRSEQQSIVFGFPYELTLKLLEKYGSKVRFYGFGTPEELDDFELYLRNERSLGRQIQSVWCECASNPLLRTVDLERIRRLADEHGFALVMDETIGSFANVDVAGVADIIVTSLTKSFSCNADVMAGR
jgi:cystathionine gamma-synthase